MGKVIALTEFTHSSTKYLLQTSTRKMVRTVDEGDTLQNSLYRTVLGAWFDAADAEQTTSPGVTRCEIKVTGTSASNYATECDTFTDFHGEKGTIVGEDAAGNEYEAEARCAVEAIEVQTDSFLVPVTVFRLTFQRLEAWQTHS